MRYGLLVVVKITGRLCECHCDCGKVTTVRLGNLISGNTRSCGCLKFKKRTDLKSRFESKVEKTEFHWLWKGAVGGGGVKRGQLLVNRKIEYATHVSWELYVGPIPTGKSLLHTRECNFALCVRPTHLYPGTQQENMADVAALHTHCKFGHLLESYLSGRKFCRTCKRLQDKTRSVKTHHWLEEEK